MRWSEVENPKSPSLTSPPRRNTFAGFKRVPVLLDQAHHERVRALPEYRRLSVGHARVLRVDLLHGELFARLQARLEHPAELTPPQLPPEHQRLHNPLLRPFPPNCSSFILRLSAPFSPPQPRAAATTTNARQNLTPHSSDAPSALDRDPPPHPHALRHRLRPPRRALLPPTTAASSLPSRATRWSCATGCGRESCRDGRRCGYVSLARGGRLARSPPRRRQAQRRSRSTTRASTESVHEEVFKLRFVSRSL